jgi:hypothetical protein
VHFADVLGCSLLGAIRPKWRKVEEAEEETNKIDYMVFKALFYIGFRLVSLHFIIIKFFFYRSSFLAKFSNSQYLCEANRTSFVNEKRKKKRRRMWEKSKPKGKSLWINKHKAAKLNDEQFRSDDNDKHVVNDLLFAMQWIDLSAVEIGHRWIMWWKKQHKNVKLINVSPLILNKAAGSLWFLVERILILIKFMQTFLTKSVVFLFVHFVFALFIFDWMA